MIKLSHYNDSISTHSYSQAVLGIYCISSVTEMGIDIPGPMQ